MTDTRTRLLDAAERLVYRHGIHGTGIDAIVAEADTAKMTLYNHFASKDALVLAMLDRRHERWMAWLTARVEALGRTPRTRALAVFTALEEWFATPDFHGCAFVNAAGEYADARHPIRKLAARHKADLHRYLCGLADAARLRRGTGDHLLLLVEGAIATAMVSGRSEAADLAARAAKLLLAPASVN